MGNSVDPDGTAHYEPSHQNLHCLHRYLFWSAVLKEFIENLNLMLVSLLNVQLRLWPERY